MPLISEPLRDLAPRLASDLARRSAGPVCVGYSGGLDSTVLLHALAALPEARSRGLGAIHVDHGLHPESTRWSEHCRAVCDALDVPLQVLRVQVEDVASLGLEAAARGARHAAFATAMPKGALLALAHHRDDQAETLLLRLLHGAGHEGLAGMRDWRSFGPGWLWRPLLDHARAELLAHAQARGLAWIEDPANADQQHARNHLRHAVMPILRARWPDAARRIASAASRVRDEAGLLDLQASEALALAQGLDPHTLSLPAARAMPMALTRLVLGLWLDQLRLPRPPPGIWSQVEPQLLHARSDAAPCLRWHGAELRRHRDLLYAMAPLAEPELGWSLVWDGRQPLSLPRGFGTLSLQPTCTLASMQVRPRRGGERLQQAGANRELRTLLQDLGIPPWIRARMPLLQTHDGTLLAAGDVALAPDFAQQLQSAGTRLCWSPHAGNRHD